MYEITCAMCGHTFDPVQHRGCAACPLQSGCQLACCPNCGYEAVDPSQSVLVRAVARLFRKPSQERPNMQRMNIASDAHVNPILAEPFNLTGQRLTELPPGTHARMLTFAPDVSNDQKAHLQAYGVIPGHDIWIRQHKPVTVIQVEHTELAFESTVADAIYVEKVETPS